MANRAGTIDRNDSLRITDQFRTRKGMAYELRERGARLTVLIAEHLVDGRTEWLVEASSVHFPAASVARSAATRAEGLRLVGAQWADSTLGEARPAFDWDAVAKALTAVRAI